ncbi:MAG TPA: type II/IV secretion system protein, partial [Methylomirabilota bacterium]|nr:type II/IV secretion system protein [Methylomirabilota bacterium]
MAAKDDYLIDNLIDLGYLTQADRLTYESEAAAAGMGVIDLMLERKVITPAVLAVAKGAHFGVEVINLGEMRLEDDVIASVPRHIAKRYKVVPVYKHGNHLAVALSDPSDLDTIDSLHHLLKADIEVRVTTEEEIEAALKKYYGAADESDLGKMIQDITEGEVEVGGTAAAGALAEDEAAVDADAPIIKL